tara:strand:- start:253 stop:1383 length:1131 start_codon:yes stop_codon:yes gene_type:complete
MLTILTLNILLMIVYLSHWDWNLYKSRKDIISNLDDLNFTALCPQGNYTKELKLIYKDCIDWKIDRKKIIDIKGITNLKKILNSLEEGSILHSFTLKTGILYSITNLFIKNKFKSILSINGLGYLFSNNLKARFLKFLLSFFIKRLFNASFEEIIFQNENDMEIFLNFSNYSGNTSVIHGSGIEINNYVKKDIYKIENLNIIFVSRLLIDKGVNEYIELIKYIKNPYVNFYLAGEIDEGNPNSITAKDLEKIINDDNLEYIGPLNVEKDLFNYDISMIMSKYEGFSRILLESLYVGLFCVSNNIPGTEWLKDFNNGLLVENNNLESISEVINNFNKYESSKVLAEKDRDIIKNNYSTKIISNQYKQIYNNLANKYE